MEINTLYLFLFLLILFIAERLVEVFYGKNNFNRIQRIGGKEFGRNHYKWIVLMHTAFFISLVAEFLLRSKPIASFIILPITLLVIAQILRLWVILTLRDRWTTRIIVLPHESLVSTGPFQYMAHPNYLAVVLEIASLPLIFNLYVTAVTFSILNGLMLLLIRIPEENAALEWSQHPSEA